MAIFETAEIIEKVPGYEKMHTVVVDKSDLLYQKLLNEGYKEISDEPIHGATMGQVVMGVDQDLWDEYEKRMGEKSHKYMTPRNPESLGGTTESIKIETPLPISAAMPVEDTTEQAEETV